MFVCTRKKRYLKHERTVKTHIVVGESLGTPAYLHANETRFEVLPKDEKEKLPADMQGVYAL